MGANQTSLTELTRQSKTKNVKQMGVRSVQDFMNANRSGIEHVLPKHMNVDRLLKIAMHAIRTTPALQECNVASLIGATVQCSQLGLEPNTILGHAYLVPFWNNKRRTKEVQLIPGYKGLIDLARRSGQVQNVYAYEVYKADYDNGGFCIELGTDPSIRHTPALMGRGGVDDIIGFYAVAQFVGGGNTFEWMEREKVDAVRDGSQGYKNAMQKGWDHPWIGHYIQMGRKTPIRRLSNYVPLSIEFQTASALDGMAEAGKPQGLDEVLTGEYTVMPEDAPTEDGEQADPEQAEASAPDEISAADKVVLRIQAAKSRDQLDDIMDQSRDHDLQGQDKAKVTRAYNQAADALSQGEPQETSAQGAFGGEQ